MSIKRLALSLTLILSAYSWTVKAQDVAAGEKIFTANCVSCHAIGEQVVGPALKDVHKRKDEAWLIKWIKNSDAVIKSGDAYAFEIFNKFNKILMQAVENGSTDALTQLLVQGVSGTQQIPGKHGGPTRESATVFVSIPDQPGALARLFADAGESGVNIEDVRIDHDPGRDTGLFELGVEASYAKTLLDALESKGWVTHL